MTNAEQRALEVYPYNRAYTDNDIEYDGNFGNRLTYIEGYEQAETDLELTWEDISIIRQIMFDYNRTIRNEMAIPNDEEYCKEVLKRFQERKEL